MHLRLDSEIEGSRSADRGDGDVDVGASETVTMPIARRRFSGLYQETRRGRGFLSGTRDLDGAIRRIERYNGQRYAYCDKVKLSNVNP